MGIPAPPESVSENPAEEPDSPGTSSSAHKHQRVRRIRRLLGPRTTRVVLALIGVAFVWLCWSVGRALTAPDDDSMAARIAEWGRDHHLGPLVTFLKDQQYKAHPPHVGGTPTMALTPDGAPVRNSGTPSMKPVVPARLVSPAGPALPGEGTWQTLGSVHFPDQKRPADRYYESTSRDFTAVYAR